jgi:hypothetical protein
MIPSPPACSLRATRRRAAAIASNCSDRVAGVFGDGPASSATAHGAGGLHAEYQRFLRAARELQGPERLEQITCAVLERSGGISIIPRQGR